MTHNLQNAYHLRDHDNRDDDGVTYELEGDASRIIAYLDGPLRHDVRPESIPDVEEAIRALNAGDFDVAHTALVRLGVYLTRGDRMMTRIEGK